LMNADGVSVVRLRHGFQHLTAPFDCRCEGMSTYPRTYDLIHADSVFTLYKNRYR
jgi:hypothetical protein